MEARTARPMAEAEMVEGARVPAKAVAMVVVATVAEVLGKAEERVVVEQRG